MTACFRRAGTVEDSQERLMTFLRISAKMEVFVFFERSRLKRKQRGRNNIKILWLRVIDIS